MIGWRLKLTGKYDNKDRYGRVIGNIQSFGLAKQDGTVIQSFDYALGTSGILDVTLPDPGTDASTVPFTLGSPVKGFINAFNFPGIYDAKFELIITYST